MREAEARAGGLFGGTTVTFVGDFGLQPPVLGQLMYAREPGGDLLRPGGVAASSSIDAPCQLTANHPRTQQFYGDLLLQFYDHLATD